MKRIYLSPPDVGAAERDALLDAFDSGWMGPVGPHLDAFEAAVAARLGWPGAVAVSSGTAALHLALLVAEVQPGDVVICSTFTFVATANAVTYVGAEPVFVDSEPESWNMSPVLLADAFARVIADGRRVGAVIMVDLYGQCADADPIRAICAGHSVPLIEDAAEALGATYCGRPAGTLGDLGVLSFNGNKIITTSGGGMLVAPETAIADRVRYLATQAREPVTHYEHVEVGFNYRMSNLLAAVGAAQLSRLDAIIERRQAINDRYRTALGNHVEFMPQPEWSGWNAWLTCVLVADQAARERLIEALGCCEIEARPLWKPMHLQPVYKDALAVVDGTSESLFERGVCLPSSGSLSEADVDRVLKVVTRCLA